MSLTRLPSCRLIRNSLIQMVHGQNWRTACRDSDVCRKDQKGMAPNILWCFDSHWARDPSWIRDDEILRHPALGFVCKIFCLSGFCSSGDTQRNVPSCTVYVTLQQVRDFQELEAKTNLPALSLAMREASHAEDPLAKAPERLLVHHSGLLYRIKSN